MILHAVEQLASLLRREWLNLFRSVTRRVNQRSSVVVDEPPLAGLIQCRTKHRPRVSDIPRTGAVFLMCAEPPLNLGRRESCQPYFRESRSEMKAHCLLVREPCARPEGLTL